METEGKLLRVYEQIFDTWRSQVDSYWQRSNYFAAFETAAIAGCWHLLEKRYLRTEITASLIGIALTIVWAVSNSKTHAYVRHWWKAIIQMEEALHLSPNDFAKQLENKPKEVPYRSLIQAVPILFGLVWLILFILGLTFSCKCEAH